MIGSVLVRQIRYILRDVPQYGLDKDYGILELEEVYDFPTGERSVHELKIKEDYFFNMLEGDKNFELRKLDRDYKVGDILILKCVE